MKSPNKTAHYYCDWCRRELWKKKPIPSPARFAIRHYCSDKCCEAFGLANPKGATIVSRKVSA